MNDVTIPFVIVPPQNLLYSALGDPRRVSFSSKGATFVSWHSSGILAPFGNGHDHPPVIPSFVGVIPSLFAARFRVRLLNPSAFARSNTSVEGIGPLAKRSWSQSSTSLRTD